MGHFPALPEGLNFTNGTFRNAAGQHDGDGLHGLRQQPGGTGVAYLTITVLEPVATVVYVPRTSRSPEARTTPASCRFSAVAWSLLVHQPRTAEGMVFDNGSITGVPLVNSTNTTYTVMALNSGGMAFAFLNITVVEPVAVLAFNESFLGTRGETLFNATVNNTGGMVATWEIEPPCPKAWVCGTVGFGAHHR